MKIELAMCALLFGVGCQQSVVSQTSVTAADIDRSPAPRGCPDEANGTVEFQVDSTEMKPSESRALDLWAGCLAFPEMQHTTVVIAKPEGFGDQALYQQRAIALKAALVARGVEISRIVIASRPSAEAYAVTKVTPDQGRVEMLVTGSSPASFAAPN